MRLLNTSSLVLREFLTNIPDYAILSHTWGDDEVTYQDLLETHRHPDSVESNSIRQHNGYRKVVDFCRQARDDEYEWAWADTCCIDKTSSAELSEAINSMYKWYSKSSICYVFLQDVEPQPIGWHLESSKWGPVKDSRWFSRGWTLQELIAPEFVTFFANDWSDLGSKFSLETLLVERTRIPKEVLRGRTAFRCLAAERMSWAADRETSREEDMAYSLMGLFDIHMPLLYGEGGPRAFLRLQEEIWKRGEEFSLLLWDAEDDSRDPGNTWNAFCVLAPHPRFFKLPLDIPVLSAHPQHDSFLATHMRKVLSWNEITEARTSFTQDMFQKLVVSPPTSPTRTAELAHLARYSEAFPNITARGLSVFLPLRQRGRETSRSSRGHSAALGRT